MIASSRQINVPFHTRGEQTLPLAALARVASAQAKTVSATAGRFGRQSAMKRPSPASLFSRLDAGCGMANRHSRCGKTSLTKPQFVH
jgi:hypothetical protein